MEYAAGLEIAELVSLGRQVVETAARLPSVREAYLRRSDLLLDPSIAPPAEHEAMLSALHREMAHSSDTIHVAKGYGVVGIDARRRLSLCVVLEEGHLSGPERRYLGRLGMLAIPLARGWVEAPPEKPHAISLPGVGPQDALGGILKGLALGSLVVFDRSLVVRAVAGDVMDRPSMSFVEGGDPAEAMEPRLWFRLGPMWRAALRGEGTKEILEVDGVGAPVLFAVSPVYDSAGEIVGGQCASQVQRRVAELERTVHMLERTLRSTQTMARMSTFQRDIASDSVEWTAETARFLGMLDDGFPTDVESAMEMVDSAHRERVASAFDAGWSTGTPVDVTYRTKQGRWLRVKASFVFDERPRMSGAVMDVSDEVENHMRFVDKARQLRKAQAVETAKRRIVVAAGHAVRGPLNGILGSASLLDDEGLTSTQKELVRDIHHGGDLLLSAVDDILDFLDDEGGVNAEPCALLDLVARTVEARREEAARKGLALAWSCSDGAGERRLVDAARFRRILGALLDNAIAYTSSGEVKVEVSAGVEEPERISLRVSDSGPGIPEDKQPLVWKAFERADAVGDRNGYQGLGLGLPLVRQNAELLGGRVEMKSGTGRGTRVTVSLPCPRAADAIGAESSALPLSVLVAEDSPVNQRVIRRMLERLGHDVQIAGDGREAVEAWRGQAFDLVLMDLRMPACDGLEATRSIRALEASEGRTKTPIWALTANVLEEDRRRCLEAGMDAFLSKPVSVEGLRERLDSLARSAEARGEVR